MELTRPFQSKAVADVFQGFPEVARRRLLLARQNIFDVASATPGVGAIEETLKWGQPAYLTHAPKSGTTIRLGISKAGDAAVYVHCQTTLIADLQNQFPSEFIYDGNRGISLVADPDVQFDGLDLLIKRALTYHLKDG